MISWILGQYANVVTNIRIQSLRHDVRSMTEEKKGCTNEQNKIKSVSETQVFRNNQKSKNNLCVF